MTRKAPPALPSKQQVLEFLERAPPGAGKRDIARAFNITGALRVPLKALLREMERDGLIENRKKPVAKSRTSGAAGLPVILVVQVVDIDLDGEVLARPAVWEREGEPPRIFLTSEHSNAATIGDRVLARIIGTSDGAVLAEAIRVLDTPVERLVGVFEKSGAGGWIRPADRRDREEYIVGPEQTLGAKAGDVVVAEMLPGRRSPRRVKIIECLGSYGAPQSISRIAIAAHDLPYLFPPEAIAEAERAQPVTLEGRTDLRDIPLVTIDGSDARDFDDAVFAEPDSDPNNPKGWHLLVAIADVAHYVPSGSELDQEAFKRGNSVYFPDRVIPMLPEALSNELCSLKPAVERACMAVHIWIDAQGRKLSHRFVRGLMRSTARLTYEQAQAIQDGTQDPGDLLPHLVPALFGAYKALQIARDERGTLDLDLPERQVKVDPSGAVQAIVPRPRLDSHRLIEEFMILANVCAAETLEATKQLCMYRVHDEPSREKLEGLREFLGTLDLPLSAGQVIQPHHFMRLLDKVRGSPHETLVNEVVLRAQAQAQYSPENLGHFGLALRRYAHFTSPIRRYADLMVHRALIQGLHLGRDGLPQTMGADRFGEIAEHISTTERRAAQAERDVVDRYTAAFLAAHRGAVFSGRVSGVTRFGLFVRLDETGADGLVPIRSLPADYYHHDDALHRLVGDRNGLEFSLGQRVQVKLMEADAITGSLGFELEIDPEQMTRVPRKLIPRAKAPRPKKFGPKKPTRRR